MTPGQIESIGARAEAGGLFALAGAAMADPSWLMAAAAVILAVVRLVAELRALWLAYNVPKGVAG